MQIIISILMLFILTNCFLKLTFRKGWWAVVFGLVCGLSVILTYGLAISQSKTQLASYLENTEMLKNMAVVITIESCICFGFCFSALNGKFGARSRWWAKILDWYPSLLVFPVLFFLQTELIFSFPGISFQVISYVFAAVVVAAVPLLRLLFLYLLPEHDLRLETHFLVSLFVCIIGLLTTVNGDVTYLPTEQSFDWKTLVLAFLMLLAFFLVGVLLNKLKWPLLQKLRAVRKHE